MSFIFGSTSLKRIEGVHPILIECATRALSYGVLDLTVPQYGGLRTMSDQSHLVSIGASKTMKSMHLRQPDGYGHAIDLAPYPVDWNDLFRFAMMGSLMFRAASELKIELEWGGTWKTLKDFPHFQIKALS